MNIKTKYCIGDIIHVIDFDMDDKVYVVNSYIVNDIVIKLEDGNTNIYYNNDYNENSCWDNIERAEEKCVALNKLYYSNGKYYI